MSVVDKIASLKASLPSGVTLVAVSKTYPPSAIMEAYEAGQRVFGENRPQELAAKQAELPGDIEWHLIGGLQTNKVKLVAPFVSMIHSAESARLLRELEDKEMALSDRSRRVAELEGMLRSREEAIDAIRRKVTDALTGFEGKGLSISIRNGNVYVSMDDKLLFRSGSFEIDPNGARAVRDLSEVLAQNPDINVMVEGHTDDVPYRSNGQLKDNLDLSAKRATTVVRLLLENKQIAPSRIIAAGRGESLPVDPGKTSEARAKNRRTEIILTPKLDELMQLMKNEE